MANAFIGTAGWNIPTHLKDRFLRLGTHLEKYSEKLNCVEINSSFYRNHSAATYSKWRSLAPEGFLFSVKLLKYFTHERRLAENGQVLKSCLNNIFALEDKLGALLVQLPPSLVYEEKVTTAFFKKLSQYCKVPVVLEPRHASWASNEIWNLLEPMNVHKVMADPEPCKMTRAQQAALKNRIRYYRLHGRPKMYKSSYEASDLERLSHVVLKQAPTTFQTWVIFDNSAHGHATQNALDLRRITNA